MGSHCTIDRVPSPGATVTEKVDVTASSRGKSKQRKSRRRRGAMVARRFPKAKVAGSIPVVGSGYFFFLWDLDGRFIRRLLSPDLCRLSGGTITIA